MYDSHIYECHSSSEDINGIRRIMILYKKFYNDRRSEHNERVENMIQDMRSCETMHIIPLALHDILFNTITN